MTLNFLVGAVVVTSALLLHELGHLLAARALGCKVEGFYFWRGGLVGGPRVAIWTMQRREAEFWVALAGPIVNILLAEWIVLPGCPSWTWANWIVAGIALAPLHGSDGRRAWLALRGPRTIWATLSSRMFDCQHPERNRTWPRTVRKPEGAESYQICLDCGRKLPYTGHLVTK
jgi:hypothetical protein